MSLSSERGKTFELDVAKLIRKKTGKRAVRDSRSGALWNRPSDISTDLPDIHIECKDHETVKVKEWMRQATEAASFTQKPVVAFEHMDGNTAGYSYDRNVAVSPVAPYPFKTLIHEIAHIESGHTTEQMLGEYALHRGLFEFEAEGTAYLALHELGEDDKMDASESRAYIQTWLRGENPPDSSIKKVFKVTDTILRSGRE
jgi:hypothetical protein